MDTAQNEMRTNVLFDSLLRVSGIVGLTLPLSESLKSRPTFLVVLTCVTVAFVGFRLVRERRRWGRSHSRSAFQKLVAAWDSPFNAGAAILVMSVAVSWYPKFAHKHSVAEDEHYLRWLINTEPLLRRNQLSALVRLDQVFEDDAEITVDSHMDQERPEMGGRWVGLYGDGPTISDYYTSNPADNEKDTYAKNHYAKEVLGIELSSDQESAIAYTHTWYKRPSDDQWNEFRYEVWQFVATFDSRSPWRILRFDGGLYKQDASRRYNQLLKQIKLAK